MVAIIFNTKEEIYGVWWGPEYWHLVVKCMAEILPTMHEECRYYKRTHNNVLTTYFTLALKHPAPTLVLYNIERLLGQNQEAGIKPTPGGLIISHFRWYSMSCLYGSRLKTGSSRPSYSKLDFGNTRCLCGQHWRRNAGRSYSKLLLLLLSRVNKVSCQLQYHHQT